MHDLIFAVAFVAMVASPAMVAAIGGRKEYNPAPQAPSLHQAPARRQASSLRRTAVLPEISVRPFSPVTRPQTERRSTTAPRRLVLVDGPTLPMRNARGMAGR